MTLGIPIFCFVCFLALSSIAIFAPRRAPAVAVTRFERPAPVAPVPRAAVAWPETLDARAAGADAAVRLAMARELGACRGRWAFETVAQALAEEPDPAVAAALADALAALRLHAAQG
jgi:hypothetical protein